MFKVQLKKLGKSYNYNWVFRNLDYQFQSGTIYGVKGPNGSGKSTLIQILSGFLSPSEGTCRWIDGKDQINVNEIYSKVSMVTPYMDLPKELTLDELWNFHNHFKASTLSKGNWLEKSGLGSDVNKRLKYYSSGMQQRAKLAFALFSNSQLVLLDEPSSNLDEKGRAWFQDIVGELSKQDERLIIIASNESRDFSTVGAFFDVTDFKFGS